MRFNVYRRAVAADKYCIFAAVRLHSIARSESAQMFSTVSYHIERKIQPLERSPRCLKLVDLVQREMIKDDNLRKAPM